MGLGAWCIDYLLERMAISADDATPRTLYGVRKTSSKITLLPQVQFTR